MVVEHEQNASDDEDEECSQSQRSQEPGDIKADHPLANFGGEQMQEDVLLNGQRAMQRACTRATAEDRAPHSATAQPFDDPVLLRWHAHILRHCRGGMSVARSTIRSPSSLTQVLSHGKGFGAGPSIFSPVRLNWLPWQGHLMMPNSGLHAVRHPR